MSSDVVAVTDRPGGVRISVVIPTRERRALVLIAVQALAKQTFRGAFEIVVVVDGSTDGTAEALNALRPGVPLTVIEQRTQGAAAARSAGGLAACGEILLFLDDDMEPDPGLLAAHDRSHRDGADIVVGHIPLHPDSPPGLVATLVRRWVDGRAARLSAPGACVHLSDLVGGQISVSRTAFDTVGGFDASLTQGGAYGNEDVEFGYRLLRMGYRAVFNPRAISWQRHTVAPRDYLLQLRGGGRASIRFARKHPEVAAQVLDRPFNRPALRRLAAAPALYAPVKWLALYLVERGRQGRYAQRLFATAQGLEYCRGIRDAGGMPRPRNLRVLAYHAIVDPATAGSSPYCVAPAEFRRQMASLQEAGHQFVTPDEVAHFLTGSGGLPRRPVLLTFDDCDESLLTEALPVLRSRGITALAFAVTARLGRTNDWSRRPGAHFRLLDAESLRQIARSGLEVGAHSRTHPSLTRSSAAELAAETAGACADLRDCGLGSARFFAYPFGEVDGRVAAAVKEAGCLAAFSVEPGRVGYGSDRLRLPRIEILGEDVGWRFRWKIATAGRFPIPSRSALRGVARLRRRIPPLARLLRLGADWTAKP